MRVLSLILAVIPAAPRSGEPGIQQSTKMDSGHASFARAPE
jgi:hypothetical protein